MRWCFDSGAHAYADAIVDRLIAEDGQAFAPILWRYEVGAVLARAQDTGVLGVQKVAISWKTCKPSTSSSKPKEADGS